MERCWCFVWALLCSTLYNFLLLDVFERTRKLACFFFRKDWGKIFCVSESVVGGGERADERW